LAIDSVGGKVSEDALGAKVEYQSFDSIYFDIVNKKVYMFNNAVIVYGDINLQAAYIEIDFEKGVPVKLNGRRMPLVALIESLNAIAGTYGVGRFDMIENRLVGIKSREVYEAPGAIALITAHQELAAVTVERDLARYGRGVSQRWTELVYDGLWFSPLRRALSGFLDDLNDAVSGEVRMTLHGGRATGPGRRSPESLYDFGMATYDTGDTFDQSLAKGFIELWGLPSKMAAARDLRVGRSVE